MASAIKFVRKYSRYDTTFYDVIREKRSYCYTESKLPKTVRAYIVKANLVYEAQDQFHGTETIYKHK